MFTTVTHWWFVYRPKDVRCNIQSESCICHLDRARPILFRDIVLLLRSSNHDDNYIDWTWCMIIGTHRLNKRVLAHSSFLATLESSPGCGPHRPVPSTHPLDSLKLKKSPTFCVYRAGDQGLVVGAILFSKAMERDLPAARIQPARPPEWTATAHQIIYHVCESVQGSYYGHLGR